MALPNFPNNPTLNQTFVVGNNTFQWDGEKWKALSNADNSLRTQLAAPDSTVLVGGVEAGDLVKSVTSVEYSSNYPSLSVANETAKNLILDKSESVPRINLTGGQHFAGTRGKPITPIGKNIVFYAFDVDDIKLKDITIDCDNNGQLDAGIIQIAGTKDFNVSGIAMSGGGDPLDVAVRPSGVNGIAVSSNGYPIGKLTDGVVLHNRLSNFTKAPINITTLAEGVRVGFNYMSTSVGNGTCPAMQNNSARSTIWMGNYVSATEGAGFVSGATGALPPYPSQRLSVVGNIFKDVGSLGLSNNEKNAFFFTDASASGEARTYSYGLNIAENTSSFFSQIVNVSELVSIGNVSRDSQGAISINNASKILVADDLFINPNKNNASNFPALSLRNSEDITIRSAIYSDTTVNALGGDGLTTNLKADLTLGDNVNIMANGYPASLLNSEVCYTKKHTVDASLTTNLLVLNVPTNRSITVQIEVTANNLRQVYDVTAYNNAGAVSIVNNTALVNYKGSVTTGLVFDITGGVALRARFVNDGAAQIVASVKCRILV